MIVKKTSQWTFKWKTSFNSDLNKQAQEVIFSRKLNKSSHSKIFFVMHHLSVGIDKKI